MNYKAPIILLVSALLFFIGCKEEKVETIQNMTSQEDNFTLEKAAILEVLNNETKAAFSRDYESWKEFWIHEEYVSKIYLNFSDSSMTETLGWDEIDGFVRTYIEAHPEPAPFPTLLNDINVRLYKNGAWVSYEQNDAERGLKRETRLMEKVDGQWKIGGMQTTIYGFKNKESKKLPETPS